MQLDPRSVVAPGTRYLLGESDPDPGLHRPYGEPVPLNVEHEGRQRTSLRAMRGCRLQITTDGLIAELNERERAES